jgi:environmental stress-induced protein Ves
VADVSAAGPFSSFPGATRVLVVIDGSGLRLKHAGGLIEARPGAPVRFSGDTQIDCELVGERVRDFNLIYDPARVIADVVRLEPGAHVLQKTIGAYGLVPLGAPAAVRKFGEAPPGSILMFDEDDGEIDIQREGAALLVLIR